MKKLINKPETVVDDALAGFTLAHSEIVRADAVNRLCIRVDAPVAGSVALVSGGGSGHEPLHAGFVGPGMLHAAVLGDVFASPTADRIAFAASQVDAGHGVLFIVKNYTGDVLNFSLAAELAAVDFGIRSDTVIVDDDASIPLREGAPGRRGTGAAVFVEKIAGAAAAAGQPLDQVAAVARRVVAQSRSLGVALTSCTTPMAGRPTFELADHEIEYGVGIHGEPGLRREAWRPVREVAADIVDTLLAELNPPPGAELAVLTNGLGGTPESELYIAHGDVTELLTQRDMRATRNLVGNYVTSLDMAGASISLLVLDGELKQLWDAPVRTAALRWGC